jgi:hypothetical protein
MQKKYLFLLHFIYLLGISSSVFAQQIFIGMGVTSDNSFREWDIALDDEEFEAKITQRWQMQNDWTEWDVSWGKNHGVIRQKWKNDPSQWELRLKDDIVTMRTHWGKDINEWIISDGKQELILATLFNSQPEVWEVKKSKSGKFKVSMYFENDPRDWEIEDYLTEDISDAMKIATAFIAVFHSSPKK